MEKLKVFLAEDEYVVREGIKNNIPWEEHGFIFCGEAADGELAFPLIQKLQPDIVITDIRMPFLDGLGLSRLIKREYPWMEILILTGFAEFDYAKEAIGIGVSQYLTKPISSEELLSHLGEAASRIRERRQEKLLQEKYEAETEERRMLDLTDFFRRLVAGEGTFSELLARAEELSLNLTALRYNLVLLDMKRVRKENDAYSGSLVRFEEALRGIVPASSCILFDRGLEGKALLFKADAPEELEAVQTQFLEDFRRLAEGFPNVRWFAAVGESVERLSDLPRCFDGARHLYAHRFLLEDSRILDAKGLEAIDREQDLQLENLDPSQFDREKVKEFLRVGDTEDVPFFVDEFYRKLAGPMASMLFRQYIAMDAYFTVVSFLEGMGFDKEAASPPDVAKDVAAGPEAALAYLTSLIRQGVACRERSVDLRYRDVVRTCLQYLQDNYANEDLSLNVLAAQVNLSPNHLSMVISQQTGQPFIRYLTDLRMNQAKELLRTTGMKTSAVAAAVGYRDPHYFSYLFKKTQGMTPTQYRGGKAQDEEE